MSDFPIMEYKIPEPDEVLPNIDAHGYVQGVYRGLIEPNGSRLKAAIAALPFERPKLAVTAVTTSEDLAERLQRAIKETGKVIDGRPATLIEKPAQVTSVPVKEELVTPQDMAKPFAQPRRMT